MIKLLKYLKKDRLMVILILVLVLVQAFAELMLPTLLANIIDIGIVNSDNGYILRTGAFMLLITLFGSASTIWKSFLSARVSSRFGMKIRQDVFTKIESFHLKEFDQVSTSSLITRTTNDITQVQTVLVQLMNMFLRAPMLAVGGIVMALSKDGTLSIVLGVVLLVMTVIIIFIATKAIPLFKALQKKIDKINLILRERLSGIRVIRAFNRTKLEKNKFKTANKDLTDTAIKINRLMASLMPIMMFLFNMTTAVVLYFGAIRIDIGGLLVGELTAFIQYATMIMFSLIMFTMMFILIPRAEVSATRINEVLDMKVDVKANPLPSVNLKEESVEFKDVSFSYNGAEMKAIEDISFKVGKGETLAIIGGTGSGKSTIINLLPKLYHRNTGEIFVGGVPIDDFSLENLREEISMVPQKAMLIGGTVRDNIQMGNDYPDDEIWDKIKTSQSYEFVSELEDGLDHVITQGGTNLSGGQKQRLSIARALIKDSLVYVFDDSFSALDFKTDSALRKELKQSMQDKIMIVIAQRVSSIKDADQILVLDNGKIVGRGQHDELLENCKVYQEIVYSQLSEEEL